MFTTPTERFEPTLAGLPDKIKREIVDFLDEVSFYEDDEDWESDDGDEGGEGMAVDASGDTTMDGEGDGDNVAEDEAQLLELLALMDPETQRMTTLSALSRVSREWNAVVSPVFWEDLRLYPTSTECLLTLVTDILPRQGHHVKQLTLRESPYDLLLADHPTSELPSPDGRALEVVQAAEAIAGVDGQLAWDLRILRARSILVARVVQLCQNVTSLDVEGCIRPLRIKKDDENELPKAITESAFPNYALEAVKCLGGKIESLSLLPPDGVSTENDAAVLISSFPSLRILSLNIFCVLVLDSSALSSGRHALHTALSSLQNLRELDLGQSAFVDDAFASLPLSFPLTHLALNEYPNLSFRGFGTLVERFSSTLESLEIVGAPHDDDAEQTAAYIGKPLNLPKLVALEVSTPHKAAFLDAFKSSPLKEVFIGECPQIRAAEVVAFLEAHEETLEEVDLEAEGIDDVEKEGGEVVSAVEIVGAWCEANGKAFAVAAPSAMDSDDEDEEDEEEDVELE